MNCSTCTISRCTLQEIWATMTVYQSVKMSRGNAGARWEGVLRATWDETYAKLGSGGMNGEGVREGWSVYQRVHFCLQISADPALKSSGPIPHRSRQKSKSAVVRSYGSRSGLHVNAESF